MAANNRDIVNDAEGRALFINQGGQVSRQLIANGEVLAHYGSMVDAANPKDPNGNPRFAHNADFNFGYQPINGSYPAPASGAYTIRPGDTLESIARNAFGDAKLWYAIAEANGVQKTSDIKVGQTLTIPSRVAATQNNASGFGLLNAAKAIGDTTPNLPQPQAEGGGGGKCGGIGKLIVAVVAVVATIYTAGAISAGLGASFGNIMSAGANFLSGGLIGTAGGATATLGAIGTGAAAAAVGSIAGQVVGVATGIQQDFSWKQVGLSALSGGATAGVGEALKGVDFFKNLTIESAAIKAVRGSSKK